VACLRADPSHPRRAIEVNIGAALSVRRYHIPSPDSPDTQIQAAHLRDFVQEFQRSVSGHQGLAFSPQRAQGTQRSERRKGPGRKPTRSLPIRLCDLCVLCGEIANFDPRSARCWLAAAGQFADQPGQALGRLDESAGRTRQSPFGHARHHCAFGIFHHRGATRGVDRAQANGPVTAHA
jgi:hypothetical protein